jgi:2-oxoglutarate dehydrogenase E1 component
MHPKLAKQFETRRKAFADGEGDVDWGLAEALSLGSLLETGVGVRLAGQDTRRGTFSHRHSTLVDYETGHEYQPLAHLGERQGKWFVYDSLLSEYAALGFEYGYSVANKDMLVAWEAQFGDFVNGAQIVIDQFLVAAEDKWDQTSGLVLLLPHAYEGQGPEHSSGRLERFLVLCAEDNMQVAYPSTAGQYFHLLRRQMLRDIRKPLVVITPKSLLRAKPARTPVAELVTGTFEELLDDPGVQDRDAVKRLVLASAKVAHEAIARRDEQGLPAAVVRAEQLYPWPERRLDELLASYPDVEQIVWLQEEPRNMGAWRFVKGHLFEAYAAKMLVRGVARAESASPATGSAAVHKQEQEQLLQEAFAGL